ncbi:hypothetical protein EJB05_14667 [Eragrostis curvula]|uniref:Mediator complex subunit 15 KIX domain-containing protein n=1 Tax=Eragrostis curvula TaxID=38414 RepID=A0A5J9VZ33_9POAL|nr:hypothetical protein EJB05_14667 [Eragrostis curvula]
MNVEQAAQLPGQMSGQAVQMNQVGGSGVGVGGADGLPQHQPMQDAVNPGGIDAQFVMLRNSMREKIFEYIGRKQSSAEWRRRLPELARRLEDILFRKFSIKNDYYNMMRGPVEPQLQFAIRTLSAENQQNLQAPRQTASGAGMVPQNANMDTSMQDAILSASAVGIPSSSTRTVYAGADHLKKELSEMNKSLKEQYVEGLSDLYEISKKLNVDNHIASQKPTNQHEEVKSFKSILERSLHPLQINKSCDQPCPEENVPTYKRQMISILNSEEWTPEKRFQQSAGQAPSTSGTQRALGMLSTEESHVKKA